MDVQIPVFRVRDGRWHRADRRQCAESAGVDALTEEEVEASELDCLRPKCPLCFDY